MQPHLKELQKKLKVDEIYQSQVFTIVRLSLVPDLGSANPVPHDPIFAEGLARKSHLDEPNGALGIEIATGRALKAMATKLKSRDGKGKIQHRFMG